MHLMQLCPFLAKMPSCATSGTWSQIAVAATQRSASCSFWPRLEVIGGTGRVTEHGPGEAVAGETSGAVMWCDGRRRVDLQAGRQGRGAAR